MGNLPKLFILLVIGLGLLVSVASARKHKHHSKTHKRNRHHNHKDFHITNNYDYNDDYEEPEYSSESDYDYSYDDRKVHHHRHHGRGIISDLFNVPKNVLKNLAALNPSGAFKAVIKGYGGAAAGIVEKLGSFVSLIQNELRNLGADEWNDLFAAMNKPINYQLFTQKNKKVPHIMLKDGTVDKKFWNKKGKTKIIIHGFSPDGAFGLKNTTQVLIGQLTIKNSYLDNGSVDNLIVADWTSLTRTVNYIGAAAATRVAGADVANFLYNLYTSLNIKDTEDIHVIGFSLGAHVSGIAGNLFQGLADGKKFGRITGLDPAGPLFDLVNEKVPADPRNFLDKTDANFVDIIHCNTGIKGLLIPTKLGLKAVSGTADFFPNGASLQPGCGLIPEPLNKHDLAQAPSCSHSRCWMYYAESVGSKKYPACKCGSWKDFEAGKCDKDCKKQEKVYMGDLCPLSARGSFYLKAEIEKPYNETFVQGSQ